MSHQFQRALLWLFAVTGLTSCQVREEPTTETGVPPGVESGALVPESDLPRGQVTLLEVGAAWDAPSRAGQAVTEALARELASQGVNVTGWVLTDGVASSEWPAVSYPRSAVTTQQVARLQRVRALPTRLLVDRQGAIRHVYPGVALPEQARADIAALLKEP